MARANALADRLSSAAAAQRDSNLACDKAQSWLREAEPRANSTLNEVPAPDPQGLDDQLSKTRHLHADFLSNARLIDHAKQVGFTKILN